MAFFNKPKIRKSLLIGTGVLSAGVAGLCFAVTVPVTFISGTTAKAADVNSNFSALATAITALEAKLSAIIGTDKALPSKGGAMAYALNNNPYAGAAPAVTLTGYNSTGGAITMTSSATGMYDVVFAGMGTSKGMPQVSAYSGNILIMGSLLGNGLPLAECTIYSWGPSATNAADLDIQVHCANTATGALALSAFTLSFVN